MKLIQVALLASGLLISPAASAQLLQEAPQETPRQKTAAIDLARARSVFFGADQNKDGSMSAREALALGATRDKFLSFDLDGDGSVTQEEFLPAYRQMLVGAGQTVAPDFQAEVNRIEAARRALARARRIRGAEQPTREPVTRPVQRPVERPVTRPVQRPVQRPVTRPVERPAQRPVQRSGAGTGSTRRGPAAGRSGGARGAR